MKQLLYYTSERYLKIISYPTNTNRIASTNAIIPYSSPFGKIFFHIFSQNINFHFKFINKRLQDAPSKAWLRQKSPTRMHYVLAISQATCSNIEPNLQQYCGAEQPPNRQHTRMEFGIHFPLQALAIEQKKLLFLLLARHLHTVQQHILIYETTHRKNLQASTCRPTYTFAIKSAPRVGLEPTTPRLTAACSTIELSRNKSTSTLHTYGTCPQNRIPCT